MTVLHRDFILDFFKKQQIDCFNKIVIGVSGGADSIVLLHLLNDAFGADKIVAAHCNYHLRATESDDDMLFVLGFCDAWNNTIEIKQSRLLDKNQSGIQEQARKIRYDFFKEVAQKHNCDLIATAHHLDDQLETLLMRLGRGTGLTGLCGISQNHELLSSQKIIRPLLGVSKEDILSYAKENKIAYREDSSNAKTDYLRNKIRHHISPVWKEIQPNLLQNLTHSISHIQSAEDFIQRKKREALQRIIINENEYSIRLDKGLFLNEDPYIIQEILYDFGLTSQAESTKFLQSSSGSVFISNSCKIIMREKEIIVMKVHKSPYLPQPIIDGNTIKIPAYFSLQYEKPVLHSVEIPQQEINGEIRIVLAKDYLQHKLKIGANTHKTIAKYLKDEKILPEDRPKIPILIDNDDKIHAILPWRKAYYQENLGTNTENKHYFYIQFI